MRASLWWAARAREPPPSVGARWQGAPSARHTEINLEAAGWRHSSSRTCPGAADQLLGRARVARTSRQASARGPSAATLRLGARCPPGASRARAVRRTRAAQPVVRPAGRARALMRHARGPLCAKLLLRARGKVRAPSVAGACPRANGGPPPAAAVPSPHSPSPIRWRNSASSASLASRRRHFLPLGAGARWPTKVQVKQPLAKWLFRCRLSGRRLARVSATTTTMIQMDPMGCHPSAVWLRECSPAARLFTRIDPAAPGG